MFSRSSCFTAAIFLNALFPFTGAKAASVFLDNPEALVIIGGRINNLNGAASDIRLTAGTPTLYNIKQDVQADILPGLAFPLKMPSGFASGTVSYGNPFTNAFASIKSNGYSRETADASSTLRYTVRLEGLSSQTFAVRVHPFAHLELSGLPSNPHENSFSAIASVSVSIDDTEGRRVFGGAQSQGLSLGGLTTTTQGSFEPFVFSMKTNVSYTIQLLSVAGASASGGSSASAFAYADPYFELVDSRASIGSFVFSNGITNIPPSAMVPEPSGLLLSFPMLALVLRKVFNKKSKGQPAHVSTPNHGQR